MPQAAKSWRGLQLGGAGSPLCVLELYALEDGATPARSGALRGLQEGIPAGLAESLPVTGKLVLGGKAWQKKR